MNCFDFNYKIDDEELIKKQLLYAVATFDINKVITEDNIKRKNNKNISSATIITPSEVVSGAFDYDNVLWSHQGYADLLLSILYPNYKRTKTIDEVTKVYGENGNNVFIMTNEADVWILINDGLNMYQYNQIVKYINDLINTDYIKIGGEFMLYTPVGNVDNLNLLDEVLKKLKELIIEKTIPEQYPIGEIDFASCKSEEEILIKIDEYIKEHYRGR